MSAEPAFAPRSLVARGESAIQLLVPPELWPPLDQEPAASNELASPGYIQPQASDPDPAFPRQFAVFLAEGLAGVRPVRQLLPWMSQRGRVHLHRLLPLFKSRHQPRVLRVLTTRPAPDVVEMTMVVAIGARPRALAIRLERATQSPRKTTPQWLCTDIEAA